MESFVEKLKFGKQRMRQLCIQTALANTPASVRVVRIRKVLSGRAHNTAEISVPRPVTRRALHIFLHECAHIVLGHVGTKTSPKQSKKPRHVEEFEAEQWAFDRMREAGISVPRKSLRRAKGYVAFKIRQALRRGAKTIDHDAQRWARGGRT